MKLFTSLTSTIFCSFLAQIATADLIEYKLQDAAFSVLNLKLQSSNDLSKVLENGCWCRKFNQALQMWGDSLLGGSTAVNELDDICKDWVQTRRCNTLDGGSCKDYQLSATYESYYENAHCSGDASDNTFDPAGGCYIDAGATFDGDTNQGQEFDRDLPHYSGSMYDQESNVNYCKDQCKNKGYIYAGVQNKKECWCGNDFGKYGKVDISECNHTCNDQQANKCGGSWRNNVYLSGLVGSNINDCQIDSCIIDEHFGNKIANFLSMNPNFEVDSTSLCDPPTIVSVDRYCSGTAPTLNTELGLLPVTTVDPIYTDTHFWLRQVPMSGNDLEIIRVKAERNVRIVLCPDENVIPSFTYYGYGANSGFKKSAESDRCFMILIGNSLNTKSTIKMAGTSPAWRFLPPQKAGVALDKNEFVEFTLDFKTDDFIVFREDVVWLTLKNYKDYTGGSSMKDMGITTSHVPGEWISDLWYNPTPISTNTRNYRQVPMSGTGHEIFRVKGKRNVQVALCPDENIIPNYIFPWNLKYGGNYTAESRRCIQIVIGGHNNEQTVIKAVEGDTEVVKAIKMGTPLKENEFIEFVLDFNSNDLIVLRKGRVVVTLKNYKSYTGGSSMKDMGISTGSGTTAKWISNLW